MPELANTASTIELEGATASFYAKSVVLGNSIELKYYMTIDSGVPADDIKLVLSYCTITGVPYSIEIPAADFDYRSDYAAYSAKLTTIAAKDMFCNVTAGIYQDGVLISNILEYGIESYAYNRLASSQDENFKTLVREMVKYGKAAETYFLNKD